MFNFIKRLIAKIQNKDLYIDNNGMVRAARDIGKGESIWMTINEYSLIKKSER